MFQYYKSTIISILIVIITIFTIYGADRIIGSKFNKIYSGWNKEGYINRLPKDPWGGDYQYLNPGTHGKIDIFSFGPDGSPSDDDIGNWDL